MSNCDSAPTLKPRLSTHIAVYWIELNLDMGSLAPFSVWERRPSQAYFYREIQHTVDSAQYDLFEGIASFTWRD